MPARLNSTWLLSPQKLCLQGSPILLPSVLTILGHVQSFNSSVILTLSLCFRTLYRLYSLPRNHSLLNSTSFTKHFITNCFTFNIWIGSGRPLCRHGTPHTLWRSYFFIHQFQLFSWGWWPYHLKTAAEWLNSGVSKWHLWATSSSQAEEFLHFKGF